MTFAQYTPSAVSLIIAVAAGQTGYANTSALGVLRTVGLGSLYFVLNRLSESVEVEELDEMAKEISDINDRSRNAIYTQQKAIAKTREAIKLKQTIAMEWWTNLSCNALMISIGCIDFKPGIVALSNRTKAPKWLLESVLDAVNYTAVCSLKAGDLEKGEDFLKVAIDWGKSISLEVVVSCVGMGTKHVAKNYLNYPYVAEFLEGFVVKLLRNAYKNHLEKAQKEEVNSKTKLSYIIEKTSPIKNFLIAPFIAGLQSCAGEWAGSYLCSPKSPSFGAKVIKSALLNDILVSQVSEVIDCTASLIEGQVKGYLDR